MNHVLPDASRAEFFSSLLNDTLEVYEAAADQEQAALSAASSGHEPSNEAAAALRNCFDS
ncbi:MAG: hypothetical protein AVDCRST_MAG15-2348 [uncultured Rubellimicrobium sp.]|uniref:Uncharacterized protein n=1 Tax=uncultured Rubellimicrobium sp. TaxID=543078 RepID=A0A6J4PU24_9RHOB|nr:MAG: hypothetical protein AVDCRST_MAG15-2348 [uncultured Rubellimicrobium sp.]